MQAVNELFQEPSTEFKKHVGYKVTEIVTGRVVIELELEEEHMNRNGQGIAMIIERV